MNQLLLGRALEQQGHSVEFAENGRRALDLLGESRFDLMLLDVEMPEVDGYEVLAEMKDDPRLREVPVIMTSALDELDSVVRCIEMGAEDYLTKPVNPVLLKRPRRVEPREEAPPRPAARADQQVRDAGGRRGPADVGLLARRQVRRRGGDVLRHPLVHHHRRGPGPGRDDRALERLLHVDDGRDRQPGRGRQPDGRRRPDGDLRCPGRRPRLPPAGGAGRRGR